MAKHEVRVPLFDDFGNPVKGGSPSRTFERKNGCFNCTAFETGETYTKRAIDLRQSEVRAGIAMGLSLTKATARAIAVFRALVARRGAFGICMKGKVQTDLVAAKHMCDAWSGRTELADDVKRNIDDPVEALYDGLGEKPTDD